MTMLVITSMTAAAFAGALLGGLFSGRRRRHTAPSPAEPFVIDPLAATAIDHTAAEWSQAESRPETEDLLADKLRLSYALRYAPRPPKRKRRWGR